ncbi:ArsR/SmtB family transcription factor [Streptomyces sp. NPDC018019]|uniref:ArsR/SmtB family transcription factor n=1 Tax=Streptomyces sp. NPDC018019 TaxID=3365030 RepID=UPI00379DCDDF
MLRIHFTAADLARVRFAPRPAPLIELNTAFMKAAGSDDPLLFGRWRQRLFRSLPPAVRPLRDLAPAGRAPAFLDAYDDSLPEALEAIEASHPTHIRAELQRVYAATPHPPPSWIRALHQGDTDAWHLFRRAQHTAFETVLRPVWNLIQDLHRAEFTRYALTTAEHGTAHALTHLIPGTHFHTNTWVFPAHPTPQEIHLTGQGLTLHPTFHWTTHPLIGNLPPTPSPPTHPNLPANPSLPTHPLALTYPAGPGLPLTPPDATAPNDPLTAVLGHTRAAILRHLATPQTTTALARHLNLSTPTISTQTTALRTAGLLTTTRTGRSVTHKQTPLGALLTHHTNPL